LGNFDDIPLETLVLHGLKALSTGVGNDEEISEKNIEVSHVGEDGFKILKTSEIKSYLDKLQNVGLTS
jgi:20S proteasome alpha/beta subunit